MIVRNESKLLEAGLKQIRPYVAEICIVDTGSADSTPEIAKKYADKFEIYTDCNDADGRILDFSKARSRSFSHATQPWVMWMDGDDEIVGAENLFDVIHQYEDASRHGPVSIMMPYEYSHDANGNCTCLHYRERLMSPVNAFRWTNWVHEVMIPINGSQQFRSDAVKWVHHRNESNKPVEPGRNLRILKAMYEKFGESDARHLYYLGLEYGNNGDIDNSLKFLKRYFDLSGWDEEKYMACLEICKHHLNRGEYSDARDWALKATTVRETWGEAYFIIAKCCYFLANEGKDTHRNWERCIYFSRHGLSLPPTQTVLFVNPLERDFEIYKYLNVALNSIGDIRGALESCREGLKKKPDDGSLKLNESIYDKYLLEQGIAHALNRLHDLGHIDAPSKIAALSLVKGDKSLLESKQIETQSPTHSVAFSNQEASNPVFLSSENTTLESGKKDIIIYVGPGVEGWNPETASKTGLGGSETAVIEMGKRLVSLGHKVRVFGDCERLEGLFDGVEYLHHSKYCNLTCDILITSRRPQAVDEEYGIKSKINFCWVHDVNCGSSLTHSRSLKIDKFLCLSKWHKSYFLRSHEFVHPDQVIVTRNGIDLSRFQSFPVRDPKRAVYSSSPDRGMEVAITIWPRVRERVPGAELHIFYGFQTWEACADEAQWKLINRLKQMLKDYETAGVFFHGRVSQSQLAQEYMKSGVWPYSTWFSETSAITAMEAQAAGLRIVTSPIAALNETVGERGTMIHGDWLSLEYQNAFIDAVVQAMNKPDDSDREQLKRYARENFSWDGVASSWDKMFDDVMIESSINIMPPYKGIK